MRRYVNGGRNCLLYQKNKDELELAINSIFPKLMVDYRSIPESKARKVGVEGNVKGTFISVSDTVAYLIGWGKTRSKMAPFKISKSACGFS